jgi:S-adenosylmethionine hydrolase
MGRRYDVISFLSDAGTTDESVGVAKAVIREIAPHVTVIDVTHGIAPFDVRAGSLALARAVPYLPSGIVLGVVDPGAGTSRRAVAIEVAGGEGVMVGPDNGLLAPAVRLAGGGERAVVLTNPEHLLAVGGTWSGRDIFAPAAAALCNGVDLGDLGAAVDVDELVPGLVPLPRQEGERIVGEVLWVDHYGNCQLNIGEAEIAELGERVEVSAGEVLRVAALVEAFDTLGPGAVGLLVDGSGMLTLVLARRSAAEELGVVAGDAVTLGPLTDGVRTPGTTSSVQLRPR